MIHHWRMRRLLRRSHHAELAAPAQSLLEEHLAQCPECAGERERLSKLDALLVEARPGAEVLPPTLSRQLFETAYEQSGAGSRRRGGPLRPAVGWGLVVSTLLAGVLGWRASGTRAGHPDQPLAAASGHPAAPAPPELLPVRNETAPQLARIGRKLPPVQVALLAGHLSDTEAVAPRLLIRRKRSVAAWRPGFRAAVGRPTSTRGGREPDLRVEPESEAPEGFAEEEELAAAPGVAQPRFTLVVTGQEPEPEASSCLNVTVREAEATTPGTAEVTVRHLDRRGASYWARCTVSSAQPSELLLSRVPAPEVCSVPEEKEEEEKCDP